MRLLLISTILTVVAFGQSDRGTINGTVTDPTGAVIPAAKVAAQNVETGLTYETTTTPTGNYTLASLPSGTYSLSVEAVGFKRFTQTGITVQVAQTGRIDVSLVVGAGTESVTVTANAPLLKTDSGEQSHNITGAQVNALPINYGARGTGGELRDPYSFIEIEPGANITGSSSIRVNGMPNDSDSILLEGQEASNSLQPGRPDEIQPSVEAVQEVALQTSNFAAEYGQVGGGLFNLTMKSGTNNYHGSAYELWKNEALNAGIPFTNNGNGHLTRPRNRSNDFGFSLGGPLWIPHVYNGRNRTFFFVNYEMYRNAYFQSGTFITLPTNAMRQGDFSGLLTGRVLGTDPLGRSIPENTIYDPATASTINGQVEANPFPGNIIPQSRFDPVAAKIQALIPAPQNASAINNFQQVYPGSLIQGIPSVKIDHSITDTAKITFYIARFSKDVVGAINTSDGLPVPITANRTNYERAPTVRLNYDQTITPRLLVHVGIGYESGFYPDHALESVINYPAVQQLGLVGSATNPAGFPRLTGLSNSYGGAANMGPPNYNSYHLEKPTGIASATYVLNNHTLKAGLSWRIDAFTDQNVRGSQGVWNFSNIETALPSTNGQNLSGGVVGFPYASFLLGLADSASVQTPQDAQLRKMSWGLFVQDSWKVNRKLTLDYGVRWDYQSALREIHNRMSVFDPNTPNPSAGGLPGAMKYNGYGPGRCNCSLTSAYPDAIGPRLGVAYQVTGKTVIRAGWGLTYGTTAGYNFITNTSIVGFSDFNALTFVAPAYGSPAAVFSQGLPYTPAQLYPTSLNVGARPGPNQTNSPPYYIDPNGGRPSRVNQWSIGVQREIKANLVAEAAYVGNRGVWEQANGLVDLNAVTPQHLASLGLNITSSATQKLLTSTFLSGVPQANGFNAPYAGFPVGLTLAQSLRPYPQFGSIPVLWAPLGNTWYDSLQAKVTKRYSYGLDLQASFAWQKELDRGTDSQSGGATAINDVFNRDNQKIISPSSLPFVFAVSSSYRIPSVGGARWARAVTRGWTLGGVLRYQSGLPILVPYSNNGLNSLLLRNTGTNPATFDNRVPGQPLFLQDLNCHCFDPNKTLVLNPKAWVDPGSGQWGTAAAYYNDYRYQRRPDENMTFGRVFQLREGMTLQIRAELYNVFNRTEMNNPTPTNAAATAVTNSQGQYTSGFGFINTGTTFSPPRSGQLTARFQF